MSTMVGSRRPLLASVQTARPQAIQESSEASSARLTVAHFRGSSRRDRVRGWWSVPWVDRPDRGVRASASCRDRYRCDCHSCLTWHDARDRDLSPDVEGVGVVPRRARARHRATSDRERDLRPALRTPQVLRGDSDTRNCDVRDARKEKSMKAMVVYESMFGNTAQIAKAIAVGLGESVEVVAMEVSQAPADPGPDVGLIVGGGPTHAFSRVGKTPARTPSRRVLRKGSDGSASGSGLSGLPSGRHDAEAGNLRHQDCQDAAPSRGPRPRAPPRSPVAMATNRQLPPKASTSTSGRSSAGRRDGPGHRVVPAAREAPCEGLDALGNADKSAASPQSSSAAASSSRRTCVALRRPSHVLPPAARPFLTHWDIPSKATTAYRRGYQRGASAPPVSESGWPRGDRRRP